MTENPRMLRAFTIVLVACLHTAATRAAVAVPSRVITDQPASVTTVTRAEIAQLPSTGRNFSDYVNMRPGFKPSSAEKVDEILDPLLGENNRIVAGLKEDLNAAAGKDAKLAVIQKAKTKLQEAKTMVGEFASPELSQGVEKAESALESLESYFNSSAYDPSLDPSPYAGQVILRGDFSGTNFYLVDSNALAIDTDRKLQFFIEDNMVGQQGSVGGISAEYGRFTGGVVNVVTRSGVNDYSGSLRINLKYDDWNTDKGSSSNQNDSNAFEDYGAQLGGPLIKDRLWFFGSFSAGSIENPDISVANRTSGNEYRIETGGSSTTLAPGQTTTFNPYAFSGFKADQVTGYSGTGLTSSLSPSVSQPYSGAGFRSYGGTSFLRRDFPDLSLSYNWNLDSSVRAGGTGTTTSTSADLDYLFDTSWGDHALKFGYTVGESAFTGALGGLRVAAPDVYGGYLGHGGQRSLGGLADTQGTAGASGSIGSGNSVYVNDRWQLNDKWSFNVGVRYEDPVPAKEDTATYGNDNFMPRIGFSYDLRGDTKYRTDMTYSDYARTYSGTGANSADTEATSNLYNWYFGEGNAGFVNPAGSGNIFPIFRDQSFGLIPGDLVVFNNGPFTTSEYFGRGPSGRGFFNSGVSLNFEYVADCDDMLVDVDLEDFFSEYRVRSRFSYVDSYPVGGGACGGRIGFLSDRTDFDYLANTNIRFRDALGDFHRDRLLNTFGFRGMLLEPLVSFIPTVPKSVPAALPNDAYYYATGSAVPKLDDQWSLKQIGISAVAVDKKGRAKGSIWPAKAEPTIVAVVDSGIDISHPELQGQLWANFKEIPNNGKDDDGNGLVDDVLGWNFSDWNNNIYDQYGHGTFIAGIIGAATNNGIGIAGINPWARIMPVKVSSYNGRSNNIRIAQGIYYAADMGARVINVSFEGDIVSKAIQRAIDYAASRDALVIVASGNRGLDVAEISPAGLSGALTVAAIGQEGERMAFSNWGKQVDIAAPGTHIVSLRADKTDLMQFEDQDYKPGSNIIDEGGLLYHLSGTSFAAPHVAGVASLLFSINPALTAEQVKRMILQSATDIDTPGTDIATGYGALNAVAALSSDPEYYVTASIESAQVVSSAGGAVLRVAGSAAANKFKTAWIELGQGDAPARWKKVGTQLKKPVLEDTLFQLQPALFKGGPLWTLRLVVQHKDGSKRVSRLRVKLG